MHTYFLGYTHTRMYSHTPVYARTHTHTHVYVLFIIYLVTIELTACCMIIDNNICEYYIIILVGIANVERIYI